MVRTYKRKTDRGQTPSEVLKAALDDVLSGKSLHQSATDHDINYSTLRRYYLKFKEKNVVDLRSKYDVRKVFTEQQEDELAAYALKCSQIGFGITPRRLRILAYQVALRNKITYPPAWDEKQCAGKDWYRGFMKRSASLSLRTPLSCSLARAASFNITNVNLFFDNLQKLLIKYHNFQDGTRIFNLDETSTTTVPHHNPKVLAGKKIEISSSKFEC